MDCIIEGITFFTEVRNYKNSAVWLIIFKVTGRPILPVPQQLDPVPRMDSRVTKAA